jgi:hypothetical protein
MATENKTQENDSSVAEFIDSLDDEQVTADCLELIKMMTKTSGHQPKMWGTSIVGFGKYHYKYESGREGDSPMLGFSPRKGKITVYVDETARYSALLARLGNHTTGKVCIYIKRLSDIDMSVLRQILEKSYNVERGK